MSLVRIVKLTLRGDAIDDFKVIFQQTKQQVRSQPGCTYLQLLQDRLHPHILFTYSHWTDAEALEDYRQSAVFAAIWKQMKPLFAAKAEAWSLLSLDVAG